MKTVLFMLFALFLMAGCRSTQPGNEGEDQQRPTSQIRVYVDGRHKGNAPGTVRIRRGFGENSITVQSGRTVLRRFEIERTYSSSGTDMVYTLENHNEGAGNAYDLSELAMSKDSSRYFIPYLPGPFVIEDREYGLTLEVVD